MQVVQEPSTLTQTPLPFLDEEIFIHRRFQLTALDTEHRNNSWNREDILSYPIAFLFVIAADCALEGQEEIHHRNG